MHEANVLFVCDDNGAASIMAEALLRTLGGRRFRAYSAGLRPAARPSLKVLEFLATRHLPADSLQPKSFMEFVAPRGPRLDFVITVTEQVPDMPAPLWNGTPVLAHWTVADSLPDMYWMLQRRIKIFASLPHARLPRHAIENRLHAMATWQ